MIGTVFEFPSCVNVRVINLKKLAECVMLFCNNEDDAHLFEEE